MAGRWLLPLLVALTACTPPPRTAAPDPPAPPVEAAPARREAAPAPRPAAPPATLVGKASWYGAFHHGRRTASGEIFDMRALTAAHRTLPLGTELRVVNLANGRAVDVRINDRGPAIPGRIIDVSHGVAVALGAVEAGVFPVRLIVMREPAAPARRAARSR